MDETRLKKYKTKLEEEKLLVQKELKEDEGPVDFGDDVDHGDEGSDRSEEEGNRVAIAQDLRVRLEQIDGALQKIQDGTYSVCERCGKHIEEEILDIDPESRFCKSDKSQG